MLVVRQPATRIARQITAQAAKVVRLHPLSRAGRTRAMIALLALFAVAASPRLPGGASTS
jgi:hypothetical protein